MTDGSAEESNRDEGLWDEIDNIAGRATNALDDLFALTVAVKAIIRVLDDIAPASRSMIVGIMNDEVARLDRGQELVPPTDEWHRNRQEEQRSALTDLIVDIEIG